MAYFQIDEILSKDYFNKKTIDTNDDKTSKA
jgi:hypothetical protein